LEDIYIIALKSSSSAKNAARQLGAVDVDGDQCVGLFWEEPRSVFELLSQIR
jgi:hypothetical protein